MTYGPVRIDIWLWAARFFKTRSLAKSALLGGKVELNGLRCKPSRTVKIGDVLLVRRGEESMGIVVEALSEQRGPATVAQTLYRETEESRAAREAMREQRRLESSHLNHPGRRPDRREREALMRVRDKD